jgi:S-adenosyl-L-methionine hydrolase (adenosine-forming)
MARPILTLTTDFGLQDHFVAVMKGVILTIAPTAEIIDITHQITPFEVGEAGFTLNEAWRYFPKGTVHVVVVDPGVGSSRRAILAQAGGHSFVAPDNGVLSLLYEQEKCKVREITAAKYLRKEISQTFHGRDVFAPAAAHLAKGAAVASFGKLIQDAVKLPSTKPHRSGRRAWSGTILKIDRFGNLITNFSRAEFDSLQSLKFALKAGLEHIVWLRNSYAEAPFGEPFAIWGSSGYLEVCVNQGNAAKQLGVGVGAPAELELLG